MQLLKLDSDNLVPTAVSVLNNIHVHIIIFTSMHIYVIICVRACVCSCVCAYYRINYLHC